KQDECPVCCPQSFEKQTDPSDKKIWIGPEVRPNDYEKRYDSDGVYYEPKPEATAELEANIFRDSDEAEAYQRALEQKRLTRRTAPLTESEEAQAIRKVDALLRPLIEDKETAYDA